VLICFLIQYGAPTFFAADFGLLLTWLDFCENEDVDLVVADLFVTLEGEF
jgi:hypothetical protein